MDFTRLERTIARDEGFRSAPYRDSLGYWTIGFGTRYDGDGNLIHEATPPMVRSVAERLMRADIFQACKRVQTLFDRFGELNSVRQEVLVNMSYNLGHKLEHFRKMRSALYLLRYDDAAVEMQDSRWFEQVGHRAVRLCDEMRTGKIAAV